jgi:hypothetical protein
MAQSNNNPSIASLTETLTQASEVVDKLIDGTELGGSSYY